MINFNPKKLEKLKKLYGRAVADKADNFLFEGNEYVVGYAKYLIEYLNSRFYGKEINKRNNLERNG